MPKKISITSEDPILNKVPFQPYRSIAERHVQAFAPKPDEKQTIEITTPWGEILTVHAGDMLVSEIKNPHDRWPVRADIFDETYVITRPGYCIKRATVQMAPLTSLTDGDEDAEVVIQTLEGPITVRAGDFYMARGPKNEIWAIPREKINTVMFPVDEITGRFLVDRSLIFKDKPEGD